MMKLVSRLKYRDFGVFMTASNFDRTVQKELIEDGHPVVLVAGGDIARMLIKGNSGRGTGTVARVRPQSRGSLMRH
jgi:hypothetical protein